MLHTVCKSYTLTREKLPQEHVLPRGEAASQALDACRFRLKSSLTPASDRRITGLRRPISPPPRFPFSVYCFLRRRLE